MSYLSKSFKTGLLVFLAGIMLSVYAQAEEGMKGNMPAFSDFDLDADGSISQAEFDKGHAARMTKMAAEGRQMKHVAECPGFAGIDSDGDDGISEAEFATHKTEHQQKMKHGKHMQEK
jgi:hypothetical protein